MKKSILIAGATGLVGNYLLGDRKEHRSGEKIAIAIMKFIDPIVPKQYKIIKVQDVAKAMKVKLLGADTGVQTLLSDEIQRISDEC